jgi:hypothetical protein
MFARRLALAIAVLAGLIGSQAPEFAQQYRQRLGGALEELNRIVSEFDAEVQRQNLSRAAALQRLEDNTDPLARERGEDMGEAIERAARLNAQIGAMNSAARLCVFTSSRRTSILRSRTARSTITSPPSPCRSSLWRPAASPRCGDGRRLASSPGRSAAAPAFARRARNRGRRTWDSAGAIARAAGHGI